MIWMSSLGWAGFGRSVVGVSSDGGDAAGGNGLGRNAVGRGASPAPLAARSDARGGASEPEDSSCAERAHSLQ